MAKWYAALVAVWVMNVFDGIMTLRALKIPGVYEANPVMAFVITNAGGAVFFWGCKVVLPALGVGMLYFPMRDGVAHINKIIAVLFSVYFALSLWHIYFMASGYTA